MKNIVLNILKYLFLILFTISSASVIYYVNKLNILKTGYFILLFVIILLIWLLLSLKVLSKKAKNITKIVFIFIMIILSCGYFFGTKYIKSTVNFVKNMTESEYSTITYSVLTKNYNDINELKDKNIGFLSSDKYLSKVNSKLGKKISYNEKDYEDIATLIDNNEVDALVLDKSFIEVLKENNVSYINESKEIYTFTIKVKKDSKKSADLNDKPFVLYISGSDSRISVHDTKARSDVNIVVVVNPQTNKILLVNIPRDYHVQLHGTTGKKDKLTHAGLYGIEMSKNTISDLLEVDIDYSVKVSFDTVVNVVDAIDGIDIDSDSTLRLNTGKERTRKTCYIKQGMNHLDGECALRYARERKSYIGQDRHRGRNQQQIITAIINKMKDPKYLVRYNKILDAANDTFETELSYEQITNLIKYQLTNLKDWKTESISLEGGDLTTETYSLPGLQLYVMVPDEKSVQIAKDKIKEYLK